MGSHSYLVNLETNIGDLHTSGLLNSHASRFTTTNVGHMDGDRSSVISLGLEELAVSHAKCLQLLAEYDYCQKYLNKNGSELMCDGTYYRAKNQCSHNDWVNRFGLM